MFDMSSNPTNQQSFIRPSIIKQNEFDFFKQKGERE